MPFKRICGVMAVATGVAGLALLLTGGAASGRSGCELAAGSCVHLATADDGKAGEDGKPTDDGKPGARPEPGKPGAQPGYQPRPQPQPQPRPEPRPVPQPRPAPAPQPPAGTDKPAATVPAPQPAPQAAPQPEPSAPRDGLSRFRDLVESAPPGAVAYDQGTALGNEGFELTGVTLTDPDQQDAPPIRIDRLRVDRIDFDGIESDEVPAYARVQITGLEVPIEAVPDREMLTALGIERLTADFSLDYAFDESTRAFTLTDLTLTLPEISRFSLQFALADVRLGALPGSVEAMHEMRIVNARMRYEDQSLFRRAVAATARDENRTEADIVQEILSRLDQLLGEAEAADNAIARQAMTAVRAFVADYPTPGSPLVATIAPPEPVPAVTLGELFEAENPIEIVRALGLTITYGAQPAEPAR